MSPLASKILVAGTAREHPAADSVVTVRCTTHAADSADDHAPASGASVTWSLTDVLPGLREGIQLMVVGETRRLWIPPELGYEGRPDRPQGVLVVDLELVAIEPPLERPSIAEFGQPAADARRTASGVAFKVLRPGAGREHPKPYAVVTLQYTAWTEDRECFDDSVGRRTPLRVRVNTLMPGLSEAIQLMVEGEKTRFWIPKALAYPPEGPPHMSLVFDVELLTIQRASAGAPGTVHVRSNSPTSGYVLSGPGGDVLNASGTHTFTDLAPGPYAIEPAAVRSYAVGVVSDPDDLMLPPGGTLSVTITYKGIVQ